jgi:hypothetical protein
VTPSKIIGKGPERIIQDAIVKMLTLKGWFVKETHGSMYQAGFPDLYATHVKYRQRWIEVKCPTGYCFTPAQLRDYPLYEANGSPIWILTAATEEEYAKLFKPSNWTHYLWLLREDRCKR